MEAEAYQKSTAAVEHSGLATTQGGVGALCIENQALTDKKDREVHNYIEHRRGSSRRAGEDSHWVSLCSVVRG